MAPGLSLHGALNHPAGIWQSMLVRIGLCIALSMPLALVFRGLPRGSDAQHVFSAVIGCVLLGWGASLQHLAHVLAISCASYALVRFAPRRRAGALVFGLSFAHVVAVHACRADLFDSFFGVAPAGSVRARLEVALAVREFQTAVMAATLKAAGFALSWTDGGNAMAGLHREQAAQRLDAATPPPLLHYLGYMLFFPAVLGHPTFFAFADYERFATGVAGARRASVPRVEWRRLARRAVEGLAFGAAHALASRFVGGCSAGAYGARSCYAFALCSLLKFYAFWRLSELPLALSGLVSGEEQLTRLRATLLAPDYASAVRHWNLPVARFLRVHVALRAPRVAAPSVTFAFSALWHGVTAGYCVAAACALLFVSACSGLRRALAPRAQRWPPAARAVLAVAGSVASHVAVVFTILPMTTTTWAETLALLRALHYAPPLVGLALVLGCAALGEPRAPPRPRSPERAKRD